MHQQIVKARKVSSLRGLGIILGIVASIFLITFISTALDMYLNFVYGGVVGIAILALEALWILNSAIMGYRYTIAEGKLYIERTYGRYVRKPITIALCDVRQFIPAAQLGQGKKLPVDRCTVKGTTPEPVGLVYQHESAPRVLLFQPDAKLRALIDEQKGIKID